MQGVLVLVLRERYLLGGCTASSTTSLNDSLTL
jgi:hypothetical protein